MLTNVIGAKCIGIDAVKVIVEVEVAPGTGIHLVGLADTAVKESLLRTITALQSLNYRIPGRKIVINLAPADVHKNGGGYDLPIALGIIASSSQAELPLLDRYLVMGELGLDGAVRDIPESLALAELAAKMGFEGCVLPVRSALEAADFRELRIFGVRNINEAVRVLSGKEGAEDLLVWNSEEFRDLGEQGRLAAERGEYMDFEDIVGQNGAKRGVEIAAAGGHNIILVGPPGSGKTSIVKAMAGILPPLTRDEAIVTSKIYSAAGKEMTKCGLMRVRPVRTPHYSASLAAMIGGGSGENPLPGEVSLAQNGILLLDEFNLMPKSVMEALRVPLEDRKVVISRMRVKVEYPASFILAAAVNPCPCGYYGYEDRCICTPSQRVNYYSRLSGPIMDRIDLQLLLRPVGTMRIAMAGKGECSAVIAERVARAREIQGRRFDAEPISTNAEMTNKMIEKYCFLSDECRGTLSNITDRFGLSMRSYFRIIRVARTIADLAGEDNIAVEHLLEAAGFRFLDKKRDPYL